MEGLFILLILLFLGGALLGYVSFFRLLSFESRLFRLEQAWAASGTVAAPGLGRAPKLQRARDVVPPQETPPPPEAPVPAPVAAMTAALAAAPGASPLASPPPAMSAAAPKPKGLSLEMQLGTRWLNWAGIILVIIGMAFFLKYAMDNQWIGPLGRVLLGTVIGAAALGAGEWLRRLGYPILFHSLSGGGIAIFYVCIFFSFQVYQFLTAPTAFALAGGVTLLAIGMALAHNAYMLCMLGQIGGFLSPILFSAGGNHPISLFTYVLILDGIAIGCALFRQWRHVNSVAFLGTALLYLGWLAESYNSPQRPIALFFSTLFYLVFLVTPLLYPMLRRIPASVESHCLLGVNIAAALLNYAFLLNDQPSLTLFAVILAQAASLVALYFIYTRCCAEDRRTQWILLMAAIALVTAAIPVQFRAYALPIAWATEAVLLAFIAREYENRNLQIFSSLVGGMSLLALLYYLPLHQHAFVPLLNRPFGSWLFVIGAGFTNYALQREIPLPSRRWRVLPGVPLLGAIVFLCLLLHLETYSYWWVQRESLEMQTLWRLVNTSLLLLWSAIALVLLEVSRRYNSLFFAVLAAAAHLVGFVILLVSLGDAWQTGMVPFAHIHFLSRISYVSVLGYAAHRLRQRPTTESAANGVEVPAHLLGVTLLTLELSHWADQLSRLSPMHQYGMASTLWSVYALALISIGLQTRVSMRRALGFALFGFTILKIFVVDMSQVEPVYRILSFIACGVLLILAGYLYQRYAKYVLNKE